MTAAAAAGRGPRAAARAFPRLTLARFALGDLRQSRLHALLSSPPACRRRSSALRSTLANNLDALTAAGSTFRAWSRPGSIDRRRFFWFLVWQSGFAFLLAAFVGPRWSRPTSRTTPCRSICRGRSSRARVRAGQALRSCRAALGGDLGAGPAALRPPGLARRGRLARRQPGARAALLVGSWIWILLLARGGARALGLGQLAAGGDRHAVRHLRDRRGVRRGDRGRSLDIRWGAAGLRRRGADDLGAPVRRRRLPRPRVPGGPAAGRRLLGDARALLAALALLAARPQAARRARCRGERPAAERATPSSSRTSRSSTARCSGSTGSTSRSAPGSPASSARTARARRR